MSSAVDAWLPKSVILLRNYDRHKFVSDLAAGVTVGQVALPLAMAFAISSGVSPQAGLYWAIVTGFVISAFGGSKTQIGGPTSFARNTQGECQVRFWFASERRGRSH
jgi:sulfate permease, SulP family